MSTKPYCRYPVCLSDGVTESAESTLRKQINASFARNVWQQLKDLFKGPAGDAEALNRFREELPNSGELCIRPRMCVRAQMTCCGQCTYSCSTRCGLDIASRIQVFLEQANPDTAMYKAVKAAAESPDTSYDQYCALINQMISGYYNADKRRELRLNGIKDNPNKYNYAPRVQFEESPTTGKMRPVADPKTGRVSLINWPDSGLCPFCLPVASARHRIVKDRPYNK